MRRVAVLVCVAIFSWGAAHAGERMVYRGRLGTQDVVLELEHTGDGLDGRYFYQQIGVDIPLRGTAQTLAEALPLYDRASQQDLSNSGPIFTDPRTGKPAAVWSGQIEGDHYTGTWRDTRSDRDIAFDLRRVAVYTVETPPEDSSDDVMDNDDITMARDPYNYLRMHEIRLTEGAEVISGNVAYRMVTDPRTRFAYPRLTRHPDPQVLARTNADLEQRHWRRNSEALACAAIIYIYTTTVSPEDLVSLDDESIQVTYLSPTLMSLTQSGSTFCVGDAHPDNHFDPLTLDLLRGGEFDFNRILNADVLSDEEGSGRTRTPAFTAYVDALAQKMEPSPEADGAPCAEMLSQNLGLYFDEDGKLTFAIAGAPYALGVCLGKVASVSLRDLGPLLRPEAVDYFPDLHP